MFYVIEEAQAEVTREKKPISVVWKQNEIEIWIVNSYIVFHFTLRTGRLSPFNIQNQVIITETVEGGDSFLRIILLVVMDKCEAFTLSCDFVLGQIDTGDVTKGFEKFLQICFLSAFRQIRDSNGRRVFIWKVEKCLATFPQSTNKREKVSRIFRPIIWESFFAINFSSSFSS